MSNGSNSNSTGWKRMLWSLILFTGRVGGWIVQAIVSLAGNINRRLKGRYRAENEANDVSSSDVPPTAPSPTVLHSTTDAVVRKVDPGAVTVLMSGPSQGEIPDASTVLSSSAGTEPPRRSSFYQRAAAMFKGWGGAVIRFAMTWGKRVLEYATTVWRYYWQNSHAIKEYLIDFDPNFRSAGTGRKEIILDADRPQVGGVWNGESWEIDLPECCVACGKRTREERNSELRIVEHFRRPVWIVIGCWVAGILWAIWNFEFSYLLIGLFAGLALGHRFREFISVRIRYQRCKEHLHRTDLPTLRAFERLMIVGTGHKTVRQQFVDLAQGLQIGSLTQHAEPNSTFPEVPPDTFDRTPIAMVDDVEGDSPIQHQDAGLGGTAKLDQLPTPASDIYISVPEPDSRTTPVSQYYRKTLTGTSESERLKSGDSPAPPLGDAGTGYQSRADESFLASADSNESYALQEQPADVAGQGETPASLQRSDFQRNLLWQESAAAVGSPSLKTKPTLKQVLLGCFDMEHVLSEAFVSMLVFCGWSLLIGLCYVAYEYRDIVLSGNKQTLLVYAVINSSLSVLFAFSLGWGTIYLLTVGIGCVIVALQEQILPAPAREWLQSRLSFETVNVELILLTTVPLLVMMSFAFLRSLSAQCGNLMWISKRAAWDEVTALQGESRPLGDLVRGLMVIGWSLQPALLAAGWGAYRIYQEGWTMEEIQSDPAYLPALTAVAIFAALYIPVGFSVAGITGSTNPFRVLRWSLLCAIDYLACFVVAAPYLILGAAITWGVYTALVQQDFSIGLIDGREITIWAGITAAVGLIQYPLAAITHMLGLVALKNETRLHWKEKPANG
ncbi:MAG: hypothetical protein ACKVT0_08655 [Planctomycetaceae bacterium]